MFASPGPLCMAPRQRWILLGLAFCLMVPGYMLHKQYQAWGYSCRIMVPFLCAACSLDLSEPEKESYQARYRDITWIRLYTGIAMLATTL